MPSPQGFAQGIPVRIASQVRWIRGRILRAAPQTTGQRHSKEKEYCISHDLRFYDPRSTVGLYSKKAPVPSVAPVSVGMLERKEKLRTGTTAAAAAQTGPGAETGNRKTSSAVLGEK